MTEHRPECPRCKSNINVVKDGYNYRCVFCGIKIKGEGGQWKLNI